MFKCNLCGKEFTSKEKLGGHISGHSRLGKPRRSATKVPKYCLNCGKEVKRTHGKYCSIECSTNYRRATSSFKGMDITLHELDLYREEHKVCEICGRPETMKINGIQCNLAVDHDHETNHFRGLLCYSCNTKLSWYENWKTNIESYLSKPN